MKNEELKHKHMADTRRLEKAQFVLKQLELKKEGLAARFSQLTKQQWGKGSNWLSSLRWNFQSRSINKLQGRIEHMDLQIRRQSETTINPLVNEIAEMEEERNTRTALGMKE
jgi:hypothetical protein